MKIVLIICAGLLFVVNSFSQPAKPKNRIVQQPKVMTHKSAANDADIVRILHEIWNHPGYKSGNRYFWLYNYIYFRIIEESEFVSWNKEVYPNGLKIFGVADNNADKEPYASLFYDSLNRIHINYFQVGNKGPRMIAGSLHELFGTTDIVSLLIQKNDKAFWAWNDQVFEGTEITKVVPKGVLPGFDLRWFFRDSIPGSYITSPDAFNTKKFREYFATYQLDSLVPVDFAVARTTDRKLLSLLDEMNRKNGNDFQLVEFNPSGFWGIVNFARLNERQKDLIRKYGLLSNAREIVKLTEK